MIITKKALSRRTVLQGMGATVALPLLDSMVPALTAQTRTAAAPIRRMGFMYIANGANMSQWTPATAGALVEMSPILSPLAPFRDQVIVLTGLAQKNAESLGDGEGDHGRAGATWLTGVHPKKTEGADVRCGASLDQVAARVLGRTTVLPSLELALEQSEGLVGSCDAGYSCVYQNTFSWRDEATPMPMEVHPRAVFERLFGEEATPADQAAQRQVSRSILDSVTRELGRLRRRVGPADRRTVDDYFETIRAVEQRIQRAEASTAQSVADLPARPSSIPPDYDEHARLMLDLEVLAYRADLTRVASLQLCREFSARTYPWIGVTEAHHGVSHHRDNPETLAKYAKVNTYHISLLAYLLEKLRNTPEGSGTLLDSVMILYGGGISDGNLHDHYDLPCLVAGGGGGTLEGGRHLKYPRGTPMQNLALTLLDKVGVNVEKLGDSTGQLEIEGLSGV